MKKHIDVSRRCGQVCPTLMNDDKALEFVRRIFESTNDADQKSWGSGVKDHFLPPPDRADHYLTLWFATAAIPFSAIDNHFAKMFIRTLRSNYVVPSRRAIGSELLDKKYLVVQNALKE